MKLGADELVPLTGHHDDGAQGDIPPWLRSLAPSRPDPRPDAIQDAIQGWVIEDLGNTPRNHLVRDLLHASLLRDRRTIAYHARTKDPAPWVLGRVAVLGPAKRQSAIQHTTLDILHRHYLGRLWREAEGRLGAPLPEYYRRGEDFGLLWSLWACRPYGVLLSPGGEHEPAHDYTCDYGRVCPWCHARRALHLFDRLAEGPCRPDQLADRYLIRIRVRIESAQLSHHPGFDAFARGRGHDLRQTGGLLSPSRFIGPREVRLVRAYWGELLKRKGTAWGVEGGIVTHQVEPFLGGQQAGERPGHRHELNLLGSMPASKFADVAGRTDRIQINFDNDRISIVRVEGMRGEDPQALRLLLAGSSYRYRAAEGRLFTTRRAAEESEGDLSGALRLIPHFIGLPAQWWAHYEATRRTKLYIPFGTWKDSLAPAVRDAPRNAARDRRNAEVGAEAEGRRARLLIAARPVYAQLASTRARKPGHAALRAALAACGREVSERDARWLADSLRGG